MQSWKIGIEKKKKTLLDAYLGVNVEYLYSWKIRRLKKQTNSFQSKSKESAEVSQRQLDDNPKTWVLTCMFLQHSYWDMCTSHLLCRDTDRIQAQIYVLKVWILKNYLKYWSWYAGYAELVPQKHWCYWVPMCVLVAWYGFARYVQVSRYHCLSLQY